MDIYKGQRVKDTWSNKIRDIEGIRPPTLPSRGSNLLKGTVSSCKANKQLCTCAMEAIRTSRWSTCRSFPQRMSLAQSTVEIDSVPFDRRDAEKIRTSLPPHWPYFWATWPLFGELEVGVAVGPVVEVGGGAAVVDGTVTGVPPL
jgi:hypothetical protein